MARYGMVIETHRCIGCDICLKACKDEFTGAEYLPFSAAQPDPAYGYGTGRTFGWPETPSTAVPWTSHGQLWMRVQEQIWGTYPDIQLRYIPVPCMHCQTAPCIDAAANGAVYRRPDGIVLIDPKRAQGQKRVASSCPYGCIAWNEEQNIPQKCTFCVHRLERGEEPRCVEACPLEAITFGDLEDPASDVSKKLKSLSARRLHPEYGTEPGVYYEGIPIEQRQHVDPNDEAARRR